MTFLEVVKTIFGYYKNDFKGDGWEEGPGIWIPKEKQYLNQDLRETDESEGIKAFDKAIEIDPDFANVWYSRALAKCKLGLVYRDDIEKALALDKYNELENQLKEEECFKNNF